MVEAEKPRKPVRQVVFEAGKTLVAKNNLPDQLDYFKLLGPRKMLVDLMREIVQIQLSFELFGGGFKKLVHFVGAKREVLPQEPDNDLSLFVGKFIIGSGDFHQQSRRGYLQLP